MGKFRRRLIAALLLGAALPATEGAAAEDRVVQEGASLRLVAGPAGKDGRFRAALLVDLEPGWKTYWLDPGEAGIPPGLDFAGSSGVAGVAARFPVPHRFDDGFSKSIVYSAPFVIALEGRAADPRGTLDLKLTLGLCRDVCVPASAELKTGLGRAETVPDAVSAAFAALPRASTASEGIVGAVLSADGKALSVVVRPADKAGDGSDLFVSASRAWSFGPPSGTTFDDAGGTARIELPVVARPRRSAVAEPFTIEAILTGPQGAWQVSGLPVEREP